MKKYTLLIAFAILLFSCRHYKSPKEKAAASIKEYVQKNFNDPDSYEPAEFGRIDSTFVLRADSIHMMMVHTVDERQEIAQQLDILMEQKFEFHQTKFDSLIDLSNQLALQHDSLTIELLSPENNVPLFSGYKVIHRFREKNAAGAKILKTMEFFFNTNFEITDIIDR